MNKILFIDDHRDTLEMVKEVARQLGIHLTICENGGEALALLDAEEFDAVILDLSMPVLDGLTIAEEIRNNEALNPLKKPVCIVFYTARTVDAAVQRIGNRVKVRAIYPKSADTDIFEMLVEVREMCGEHHQMIVKGRQRGAASPNWLICLIAVIVQIVVASLFLWLLNKQDVEAAYRYSEMRKQRDEYKSLCDTNYLRNLQKENFINNQKLILPAEMSGQLPCQTAAKGE